MESVERVDDGLAAAALARAGNKERADSCRPLMTCVVQHASSCAPGNKWGLGPMEFSDARLDVVRAIN
jgi:hypothetical protein